MGTEPEKLEESKVEKARKKVEDILRRAEEEKATAYLEYVIALAEKVFELDEHIMSLGTNGRFVVAYGREEVSEPVAFERFATRYQGGEGVPVIYRTNSLAQYAILDFREAVNAGRSAGLNAALGVPDIRSLEFERGEGKLRMLVAHD